MDTQTGTEFSDSIIVSGLGECRPELEPDYKVIPWLKSKKTRKFMGKQDELAVVAAGRALKQADNTPEILGRRTGVFLSVGYIPFEQEDIDIIAEASVEDGGFSMDRFSREAVTTVNPLLAFKCLPNMPIFHITSNFDIQGPYFISYPGIGQFYLALEQAKTMLMNGDIDMALVGGVADQLNFLVGRHFSRLRFEGALADGAGFLCLERESDAVKRGAKILMRPEKTELRYQAPDLLEKIPDFRELTSFNDDQNEIGDYQGPGTLVFQMADSLKTGQKGRLSHEVETFDGMSLKSQWSLL